MMSSKRSTIIFITTSLLLTSIFITIGMALSPDKVSWIIIMISVLVVVISWSTIWALITYRLLKKPLLTVNQACKKLTKGEYSTRITAVKKADIQVMELVSNFNKIAQDFQNLEEMRKSFVASASHELRSPLTSMQGFLHALLDGTISEQDEKDKYLKIVYNETRRLSSLINSMLDLSRMEYGNNPLLKSSFEIHDTINQVVDRFSPTLQKNHIKINLDFSIPTLNVYADKEKIIQVLINLIDNAIKYSAAFTEININTYIHNKRVYVIIKDNGIGISKKDQALIWDKFYMADKARTPSKSKGTGLGLSIVKKIIDDHKEAIWVESDNGEGAAFIFTLKFLESDKDKMWGSRKRFVAQK
jgi:signal transduction histidine kinase